MDELDKAGANPATGVRPRDRTGGCRMHRYLVVAHRTLGGPQLRETLEGLVAHGPSAFHIVVPAEPPHDHAWTEAEARHQAQLRLDHGLERLSSLDAEITSEVGDANPMQAVEDALLSGASYEAIVVSTLPAGPSRWLKLDLPHRIEERTGLRVIHVVGSPEPVPAG
jgi:hypothetical protein